MNKSISLELNLINEIILEKNNIQFNLIRFTN